MLGGDELEIDLKFLGKRIVVARRGCGLTQKELAEQTQLTPKTIQNIEQGKKNPSYETLVKLVARLGISPNALFPSKIDLEHEELHHFIWKLQSCNFQNQKMLLNILNFLAEQLLERERESERPE